MSDHPVIAIPPGTPDADRFQLQLGRDGVCRLVLLDDDATQAIAILTLSAESADRLAQEIAARRETYAQTQGQPSGRKTHQAH
ncbi:hypothetical protein [Methylorubrum populi]